MQTQEAQRAAWPVSGASACFHQQVVVSQLKLVRKEVQRTDGRVQASQVRISWNLTAGKLGSGFRPRLKLSVAFFCCSQKAARTLQPLLRLRIRARQRLGLTRRRRNGFNSSKSQASTLTTVKGKRLVNTSRGETFHPAVFARGRGGHFDCMFRHGALAGESQWATSLNCFPAPNPTRRRPPTNYSGPLLSLCRYPDFKHKTTGDPLWLDGRDTPQWVQSSLENMDSLKLQQVAAADAPAGAAKSPF